MSRIERLHLTPPRSITTRTHTRNQAVKNARHVVVVPDKRVLSGPSVVAVPRREGGPF